MWSADEYDFDPSWFNHSEEEYYESRMFFTKVKDQTDKAILFEHPQGYDFGYQKAQSPVIVEVSTKKSVRF